MTQVSRQFIANPSMRHTKSSQIIKFNSNTNLRSILNGILHTFTQIYHTKNSFKLAEYHQCPTLGQVTEPWPILSGPGHS